MGRMKNRILRIAAAFLAALVLVCSLPPAAQAVTTSGSCGSGVKWNLAGNVLQITGSGAMENYSDTTHAPWYIFRDTIYSVQIGSGVTQIGEFAFRGLEAVTAVRIANTVTSIGQYAFYDCNAMQTIQMSNAVQKIGASAFERCRSLRSVALPGTLRTIEEMAFYRCESLLTVTVPASVNAMGAKVFTYCSGLRSATILANIGELPYWTFYGCYQLSTVSLSSSITTVGVSAFENCEQLTNANYGGSGSNASSLKDQIQSSVPELDKFTPEQDLTKQPEKNYTSTTQQEQNGTTVTVEKNFFNGQNSAIETTITPGPTGSTGSSVVIEAVLDSEEGWQDVQKQLTDALMQTTLPFSVKVNTYLPGNSIQGKDLGHFAGSNLTLSIHTQQGAVWHVKGADLKAEGLKSIYDLSYTLTPLEKLTVLQKSVIGHGSAYTLVFHDAVDFNVEVELPVGQPRNVASFLALEKKDAYTLKQKVVIDARGLAHFYLGSVQKDVQYLIGINIPAIVNGNYVDDAIIPESLYGEYPPVERIDIKYLQAEVTSSLGITWWQLALILVGVIAVLAGIIYVILRLNNNRKYKNGIPPEDPGDA